MLQAADADRRKNAALAAARRAKAGEETVLGERAAAGEARRAKAAEDAENDAALKAIAAEEEAARKAAAVEEAAHKATAHAANKAARDAALLKQAADNEESARAAAEREASKLQAMAEVQAKRDAFVAEAKQAQAAAQKVKQQADNEVNNLKEQLEHMKSMLSHKLRLGRPHGDRLAKICLREGQRWGLDAWRQILADRKAKAQAELIGVLRVGNSLVEQESACRTRMACTAVMQWAARSKEWSMGRWRCAVMDSQMKADKELWLLADAASRRPSRAPPPMDEAAEQLDANQKPVWLRD